PARPPVGKSCTLGWRRHRYSWAFPNSAQNAPNCSSSLFHCSPSEPTRHRPPFRTRRADFRPSQGGGGRDWVELAVADTGIGLTAEQRRNYSSRDSPDESQTGINVRVFPALLQDRREVLTATSSARHEVLHGEQHADLPGLLRARRERPRGRRTAEQRDERSALHSITSSALARRVAGMVIPMTLAVLRLMTSSNLVGCKIGRSAGFSPLRTRPA